MPLERHRFVDPEARAQLEVFAAQVASALERARLAQEAQETQVQMETERMRSSLLSSVSHDLRTPLAVITGASSALLGEGAALAPAARNDMVVTIHEEAERLNRLVRNLLDMTRIEAGAIKVAKEWQPLDEVVGAVLTRMEKQLREHPVDVRLPAGLTLVPIDGVLIEQVLVNLLENATKYSPKGSPLELSARARTEEREVVVQVADRGPGVPPAQVDKIFEKFYRLPREREGSGAGLGLAICRGIVQAHGGRIWVENRADGGAAFSFSIPVEGAPDALASLASLGTIGPEDAR
jgi:two-component system sensor histidine kinase KdpD